MNDFTTRKPPPPPITNEDIRLLKAMEFHYGALFQKMEEAHQQHLSAVIAHYEARIAELTTPKDATPSIRRDGYVYVVREIGGIHYKIGRTTTPEDRIHTFNVKIPFQVEYVVLIKARDMRGLERYFHLMFRDKRVKGEWFMLDAVDIETIINIGKQEESGTLELWRGFLPEVKANGQS